MPTLRRIPPNCDTYNKVSKREFLACETLEFNALLVFFNHTPYTRPLFFYFNVNTPREHLEG
jgi:hypothetical protein